MDALTPQQLRGMYDDCADWGDFARRLNAHLAALPKRAVTPEMVRVMFGEVWGWPPEMAAEPNLRRAADYLNAALAAVEAGQTPAEPVTPEPAEGVASLASLGVSGNAVYVSMPITERAKRLVGDMPWVTENLRADHLADLPKQIAQCLWAATEQAKAESAEAFAAKDAEIASLREQVAHRDTTIGVFRITCAMLGWDADDNGETCADFIKRQVRELAAAQEREKGKDAEIAKVTAERDMWKQAVPSVCPITRREFFSLIDLDDKWVATYGGPFDSYTIPEMEGEPDQQWHERGLTQQRYDHDAGGWCDGCESIPLRVINDKVLDAKDDQITALTTERDQIRTELAAVTKERDELLGSVEAWKALNRQAEAERDQLAGERDAAKQWLQEQIDAIRHDNATFSAAIAAEVESLKSRVAALETPSEEIPHKEPK